MDKTVKLKGRAILASAVIFGALLAGGALLLHREQAAQAGEVVQVPTPPSVEVVLMQPADVRVWRSFSGRLTAVERVEVRPRVGGTIVEVLHAEGARVKAGDPLYLIDPRAYEVAVAQARSDLDSALSRRDLARAEMKRISGLENKRVVSRSQVDAVRNDYRVAEADVGAAEAKLAGAELDLEFAHIRAPVSGRISRAEITRGNLVEAGAGAPVLTTIVADDRVYAEFDIDEQSYLSLVAKGNDAPVDVELRLAGESSAVYRGQIHAFDNALDSQSGTMRTRALFDNPDGLLIPGMFAEVRVASALGERALLVPLRAVGTNQSRKFVYVVGDDNRVHYREVVLGAVIDDRQLVLGGLESGERVMVNSLQRVRPGMEVAPVPAGADDKYADTGFPGAVKL